MAIAAFYGSDGIVTHIVKADGPKADSDLAIHINASAKQGLSALRIDDSVYAKYSSTELLAYIESITGKKAVFVAPVSDKQIQINASDAAAFDDALSKGKTFTDADLAGKTAAKATSDAIDAGIAGPGVVATP